jgi:hypothetical protein
MSRRSWQRVIVSSGARINNDGLLTGIGCARITHAESLDIIVLLRGARAGPRDRKRIRLRVAKEEARRIGQKTDPPGRGNPGPSLLAVASACWIFRRKPCDTGTCCMTRKIPQAHQQRPVRDQSPPFDRYPLLRCAGTVGARGYAGVGRPPLPLRRQNDPLDI